MLITLLFTCLALLLTGATLLATYENRYHELLRLKKESERIPEAERKARAKGLAAKVYRRYETLKYLSFKVECIDYWQREATWQSRMPLKWWTQDCLAVVTMAMTPKSLKTEISVKGKPLYTFFMNDGKCAEFKWPWNGVPGQRTEFPAGNHHTRLIRGVDGHLLCRTGIFRRPWIGVDAHRATRFKHRMEAGSWIGSAKVRGVLCDVVMPPMSYDVMLRPNEDDPQWDRWDVYYINADGFIVLWDVILLAEKEDWNRLFWTGYYTDFRTDPIPPQALSPSDVLLQEAKAWRRFTADESLAELNVELGD